MKEFGKDYLEIVLNHMFIQGASIIEDLKNTETDPKIKTKITLTVAVLLKPAFEYLKTISDPKTKDAVLALEEYFRDGIYFDSLTLSKADYLYLYKINKLGKVPTIN
jgi:hypothetical protein